LNILLIIGLAFSALIVFFILANRLTQSIHAKFEKKDVVSALKNLISEDYSSRDEFDLFISWPINDPYLESVRQRAIAICKQFPSTATQDISQDGAEQIRKLVNELQS